MNSFLFGLQVTGFSYFQKLDSFQTPSSKPDQQPKFGDQKARNRPPEPPPPYRLPSRRFNRIHPMATPPALPGFVVGEGRVSRGFDNRSGRRVLQAEEILKSFHRWPPREGELFVIQIDQDSPPPPPPLPGLSIPFDQFRKIGEARKKSIEEIQRFVTQYTGQTVVFRALKIRGETRLIEQNPAGPFRSASHTSQIVSNGQASCNGTLCGIAWVRSGIYPFKGKNMGGVYHPLQDSLIRVARDLNGDGVIDRRESELSNLAHGFAILFHAGFPGSPRSVGCQTLPPSDFEEFQKAVDSAKVEIFSYVLVRRPNEKTGVHIW